MVTEAGANRQLSPDKALLHSRVAIVYALSGHYLFFPFAALCMAAAMMEAREVNPFAAVPLLLLIAATLGSRLLKTAYGKRDPEDDPALWARRFVMLSGASGLIWGGGAFLWFIQGAFAPQAYLVLAFLGMSAAEFISRGVYRPAYLAHAAGSLLPLAVLLLHEGGFYQVLSAFLVLFFASVLYSYAGSLAELLNGSIAVGSGEQIARLSEDKRAAAEARDVSQAQRDRVEAQAANSAKTMFLSNISHELRTPLNAMLGMAQLLERGDLEKTQRDHVKILLEAGRGLKILLDDIVALTQYTDEPLSSPEEGCDAAQAARTVARLLQPNAWEKRLRLSVNIASALPRVAADSRLLRRLFLKLVGNAIKFTERGNIEVALDSAVDESGARNVRFSVTDTGPGIPQHMIGTIFEPFAKTGDASRHAAAGAGVGLAVAKRLVESIGGRIGVESEPGMGAKFWITMPALQSTVSELGRDEEPVSAPGGLSLLLYLPDESMRTGVERLLTPFGNAITIAGNLAQAATMSARGGFGLIIAGAGSVDALAAIPGQRTPILGLATREERQPDGADAVLRWPSRASELYAAVASITEGAKNSEAAKEDAIESIVDAKAIAELEKSLGLKTLIDILQSYLHTAEELAITLSAASDKADWSHTGRVAQDFAGAAGGLGLTALTAAARLLAQAARDGADRGSLSAAADDVLAEHRRVREALRHLYPDLSA